VPAGLVGELPVFSARFPDPLPPPQSIELIEIWAVVGEVKRPAIFQFDPPVVFAYVKLPLESIGMLKTLVGARPVPQR
jgi:hypothetical protein